MATTSQNLELWETSDFLGVFRDVKEDPLYWMQFFTTEFRSTSDWIDFERMPEMGRKLAPFVMPLARGKPIYEDSASGFRFKPAYIKVEDQIDPLMPLTRRVGIDSNMSQMPVELSPSERLELIRSAITAAHVDSIRRRWNWMAATSIRDGACTIKGEDYPTALLDFRRASNHSITLGVGDRFGETDVSAVDFFQLVVDRMTQAEFGGVPTKATMGGGVWAVLRKDEEFLKHMDTNLRGGNITIERGLVSGGLVYKVGEMTIGGASGQSIELWVDNSTYTDPDTGSQTRYVPNNQIVFTGTSAAIGGIQAFGRIIDKAANWEALPIFPKNWESQGDITVEYITHKSAPIFVPMNPNATLSANVIAP